MPAGVPCPACPRGRGHYESDASYQEYMRDYDRRHFGKRYSERGPEGPAGQRDEDERCE